MLYRKLQARGLEEAESEDEEPVLMSVGDGPSISKVLITVLITVSLSINFIFLYWVLSHNFSATDGPRSRDQILYSPAEDRISYQVRKFDSSFTGQKTPYQGPPSTKNNELWENLHGHGLSHISESQAALLPNKTVADQSGGENKYLVVLSVFHHLHCLDAIRKGIYYFFDDDRWNASHNPFSASPDIFDQQGDVERETETEEEGTSADDGAGAVPQLWHIDHCIDSLRQAIQCASDISPYVFQWSEEDRGVRAFADVAHTCRDFDAIKAWSDEHWSTTSLDASLKGEERGVCRHDDTDC